MNSILLHLVFAPGPVSTTLFALQGLMVFGAVVGRGAGSLVLPIMGFLAVSMGLLSLGDDDAGATEAPGGVLPPETARSLVHTIFATQGAVLGASLALALIPRLIGEGLLTVPGIEIDAGRRAPALVSFLICQGSLLFALASLGPTLRPFGSAALIRNAPLGFTSVGGVVGITAWIQTHHPGWLAGRFDGYGSADHTMLLSLIALYPLAFYSGDLVGAVTSALVTRTPTPSGLPATSEQVRLALTAIPATNDRGPSSRREVRESAWVPWRRTTLVGHSTLFLVASLAVIMVSFTLAIASVYGVRVGLMTWSMIGAILAALLLVRHTTPSISGWLTAWFIPVLAGNHFMPEITRAPSLLAIGAIGLGLAFLELRRRGRGRVCLRIDAAIHVVRIGILGDAVLEETHPAEDALPLDRQIRSGRIPRAQPISRTLNDDLASGLSATVVCLLWREAVPNLIGLGIVLGTHVVNPLASWNSCGLEPMKRGIEFVQTHYPGDPVSLTFASDIALKEGRLEDAGRLAWRVLLTTRDPSCSAGRLAFKNLESLARIRAVETRIRAAVGSGRSGAASTEGLVLRSLAQAALDGLHLPATSRGTATGEPDIWRRTLAIALLTRGLAIDPTDPWTLFLLEENHEKRLAAWREQLDSSPFADGLEFPLDSEERALEQVRARIREQGVSRPPAFMPPPRIPGVGDGP